jgi:hypothetical protein
MVCIGEGLSLSGERKGFVKPDFNVLDHQSLSSLSETLREYVVFSLNMTSHGLWKRLSSIAAFGDTEEAAILSREAMLTINSMWRVSGERICLIIFCRVHIGAKTNYSKIFVNSRSSPHSTSASPSKKSVQLPSIMLEEEPESSELASVSKDESSLSCS